MAGHSKWSKIKRKKAATDQKRGASFTKLLKEIQVAAKMGGADLSGNPRLKIAVQTAKSNSVPGDNIERAINKGAGNIEGEDYEEMTYEGYGPGGVAILVQTLTENRNRTAADVRHAFAKYGGSLGSTNSVAYQFQESGIFTILKEAIGEEALFDAALEAGAGDVKDEDESWEVHCEPGNFGNVRDALEALGLEYEGEITPIPENSVQVAGKEAKSLIKMLEAMEDLDDVQRVVGNFEFDTAELEAMTE